jgi:two-component system OmpR family sensor kinase
MTLIAILYYQNEKKLYFDLTKNKMQNVVSNISSQIILSHMTNKQLNRNKFLNKNEYKISFYDKNKKKIFGNLKDEVDFSKKIIQHEQHFILVDDSTYGHMGIHYIAIEENLFFRTIKNLQEEIIILFLLIYSIISIIGFYLARLLLKPIKKERIKLNNFIKDTTHELNTPISAILMSSGSENLSKKQVQRIQLAAHRISEIYKDLTYIFLEQKEDKQDIEKLELKNNIEEQLKYFEVIAEKKRISINIELTDFVYKIEQNDFIRLFNNILSNAIKYNNPKGSIDIKLQKNVLTIKDSGIGIEQEQLEDIFKRYHRATKEQGGFGIGLNIVQNICLLYDIKFNVKSKIKKGTTFTFIF